MGDLFLWCFYVVVKRPKNEEWSFVVIFWFSELCVYRFSSEYIFFV